MVTMKPEDFHLNTLTAHQISYLSQLPTGHQLLVFDTETTGVGDDAKILSLAITDGNGDTLFYKKINPGSEWLEQGWADAEKINHISVHDVENEHPLTYYAPYLDQLASTHTAITGYNIDRFDLRLLHQSGYDGFASLPSFDLMPVIIQLYSPYRDDPSVPQYHKAPHLTDLAAYYGITYNAHDALEDTKTTATCYQMTVERMQKLAREQHIPTSTPIHQKMKR